MAGFYGLPQMGAGGGGMYGGGLDPSTLIALITALRGQQGGAPGQQSHAPMLPGPPTMNAGTGARPVPPMPTPLPNGQGVSATPQAGGIGSALGGLGGAGGGLGGLFGNSGTGAAPGGAGNASPSGLQQLAQWFRGMQQPSQALPAPTMQNAQQLFPGAPQSDLQAYISANPSMFSAG